MKLPSIESLIAKSSHTLKRFSLALCFTFLTAALGIYVLHSFNYEHPTPHYFYNLMMSCYLGVLLSISLAVGMERRIFSTLIKVLLHFLCFAFVALYFYSLPNEFREISVIRFFLYVLSLHLLIAFIPFIHVLELNGFWQYNKIIFLRILTAGLYSGVLYVGLALALLAIDNLFKVELDEKIYSYLWICIGGIFNTWFFLAGFPDDLVKLEVQTEYPKGLKIFTQYVLLPLISIYLLILYAYLFKIIINAQWPVGWVSNLVLCFSIAGILSLLLIYPIRNAEGNKWMLLFSRFFYFALYPLLILLFLAVLRRINDYGITEQRYFVLVLALWLLCIASYFLLSKAKNIKIIPISLCFIAFASSFGPWGAFSVSLKSQQNHLSELLEKNKLLKDGKFVSSKQKIPYDAYQEIYSVTHYLINVHGYGSLQIYFNQNLDSIVNPKQVQLRSYEQENKIDSLLAINYENRIAPSNIFEFDVHPDVATHVSGFDFCIDDYSIPYASSDSSCYTYSLAQEDFQICFTPKQNQLRVSSLKDSTQIITMDVNVFIKALLAKKYSNVNMMSSENMSLDASNEKMHVRLIIKHTNGMLENGTLKLIQLSATVLLQLKQHREQSMQVP